MTVHRCVGCGATSYSGRSGIYCAACIDAKETRSLFGESEDADRWLACFYPHVLEQEQRIAANRQVLLDACADAIKLRDDSGDPPGWEFSDS